METGPVNLEGILGVLAVLEFHKGEPLLDVAAGDLAVLGEQVLDLLAL